MPSSRSRSRERGRSRSPRRRRSDRSREASRERRDVRLQELYVARMALDLARGHFSKGTWNGRRDSRSRSRRRRSQGFSQRSDGQSRDAPSSGGVSVGTGPLAYNRVPRQDEQRPQGGAPQAPASSAGSGVDRYGTREDWGAELLGKGPPVEDEPTRASPRGPGGKGQGVGTGVVDLDAWASDVSEQDRTRTGGEGEHVLQSCHGFADTGTCRFGQGCKFLHGDSPEEHMRAGAARDNHERRMHKEVDIHHVGTTLLFKDSKDNGQWKLLLRVTTTEDGRERLGWIKTQKRRGDGEEEDALDERCKALVLLTKSMGEPAGTQVGQDSVHLGVVKEEYNFRRDFGHATANVHVYALGPDASALHGEILASLKQDVRFEDLVWYCRDSQRGPKAMEVCEMLSKAGWPVNVR